MPLLVIFWKELAVAVSALFIGLYGLFFGSLATLSFHPTPLLSSTATSTLQLMNRSSSTTTSVPSTKIASSPNKKTKTTLKSIALPIVPIITSAPIEDVTTLNNEARASLVNIFCTTGGGGYLNPISGSGVIIDSRGVILTNAHVAQYFLLRDYPTPGNVNCVIRNGSPAQAMYNAEILYLPPAWINANSSQIVSQQPMGTGQNDYAFLLITTPVSSDVTLPSTFPYLPLSSTVPNPGTQVLLAAYPAGFIQGITVVMDLYATSALAAVQQLFSFTGTTADVFSLGGSVVAQAGSSGGAVLQGSNGDLVGIIVTDTASSTTAGRDLNALSISYINRDLEASGFGGIAGLLSGDVGATASIFDANVAPDLEQKLVQVIQH